MISVIDDGIGFNQIKQASDDRSHIGIENVRSRLSANCGGTLEILSKIGEGTQAIIRIPKLSAKN